MKPERVQNDANSTDTGSEPTPAEDQKNPAADGGGADPAEKKPGVSTDMKPERVQKT